MWEQDKVFWIECHDGRSCAPVMLNINFALIRSKQCSSWTQIDQFTIYVKNLLKKAAKKKWNRAYKMHDEKKWMSEMRENRFQELEWVQPLFFAWLACMPYRRECASIGGVRKILCRIQLTGFFFQFSASFCCVSAGTTDILFKVKLNQSRSHTHNAECNNSHSWKSAQRHCCLHIYTCNIHYDRFEQIMAQIHHIKQWINAIFAAKRAFYAYFTARNQVNVPTTSNTVNMGFGDLFLFGPARSESVTASLSQYSKNL